MGTTVTIGVKNDDGKPRYDLLPPFAVEEVVKALTHGANTYGDDNWRNLPRLSKRYQAAAMRHIFAWKKGETCAGDSKIHHLAHAIVSLMFILEHELLSTPEQDSSMDEILSIYGQDHTARTSSNRISKGGIKMNVDETVVENQTAGNKFQIQNETDRGLPELESDGQYIFRFEWPEIKQQKSIS